MFVMRSTYEAKVKDLEYEIDRIKTYVRELILTVEKLEKASYIQPIMNYTQPVPVNEVLQLLVKAAEPRRVSLDKPTK